MVAQQGTLFPEGAELWGRAVEALVEMDLPVARRQIASALATSAGRRESAEILESVEWLEACDVGPGAPLERAVRAFRETPEAVRLGLISGAAGRRAEEALARHLLARTPPATRLVGERAPLPVGRLLLAIGERRLALRSLLRALEEGADDHADVWSALGDIRHVDGDDGDEEAYARALALDPSSIEPFRLRHRGLADLLDALAAQHGQELARQRLLAEAWLRRLVRLPERDPWIVARAARWAAERSTTASDTPHGRARLFTLLLLEDRACDPRDADPQRRLHMQELVPDLFERMMSALRAEERFRPRLPMR